eukprot:m.74554 g.74554  ORF g.74554 m.74554 type:complete len:353 (-) comp12401_c0_seq2:735-1793(-)
MAFRPPPLNFNGLSFKPKPQPAPLPVDESEMGKIDLREKGTFQFARKDYLSQITDANHLGHGSFGDVYKVHHKESGLDFAVKQLNASHKQSGLVNDLRVARDVVHEHMIDYYGFDLSKGCGFVFMELMEADLQVVYGKVHSAKMKFTAAMLVDIFVSIGSAINFLKAQHNTLHRDIKPSNMLLGYDGLIKLCDFGISRALQADMSFVASSHGSRAYLSPEQVRGQQYGSQADVWKLGISVLEICRGERVFPQEGILLSTAIMSPESVSSLDVAAFPETERVLADGLKQEIDCCVQHSLEDRPRIEKLMDHPFCVEHLGTRTPISDLYHNALIALGDMPPSELEDSTDTAVNA